jgi:hypothetical protein
VDEALHIALGEAKTLRLPLAVALEFPNPGLDQVTAHGFLEQLGDCPALTQGELLDFAEHG